MGLLGYHLRKRGIMTYFWVANYEGDFQRAYNYGASGIMTDNPPLLNKYLLQQKEKRDANRVEKPDSI